MEKFESVCNFASENKLNQYPAMIQHEFKIRFYGRTELAQEYFPNMHPIAARFYGRTELAQEYFPNMHPIAAWAKLKLWLSINPDLCYLTKLRVRSFTPAQVEEIVKILGEP